MQNNKIVIEDKPVLEKVYLPLGLIGGVIIAAFYFNDLKNATIINREKSLKNEAAIQTEANVLRREREEANHSFEQRLNRIDQEQQFFRETMVKGLNEIRKVVYKIDGKVEGIEKIIYKKEQNKK